MRVVMPIKIVDIVNAQRRILDPKTWLYAYWLWRGKKPPFITATRVMGGYVVLDGLSRVSAHRLLSRSHITASVSIIEDPNPYTDLRVKEDAPRPVSVPQADGYSLPSLDKESGFPDM